MMLAAWLAIGMVSGILMWTIRKYDAENKPRVWCPTPLAIIFWVLCAISGLIALLFCTLIMLVLAIKTCVDFSFDRTRNFRDWLIRPICQR